MKARRIHLTAILWSAVAICVATTAAWARPLPSVPSQVSIQGTLTDSVGNPLMGNRMWRIQFYDAETGGNTLGEASSGTLSVETSGRWSISFTPPSEALDAGSTYYGSPAIDVEVGVWYEIAIDSATVPDGAIDPADVFPNRVRVESVMFARKAGDSENLGGTPAGEYATGSDLTTALAGKADLAHTHDLQDLGGAATDAQVPDDIAIDHAASADFATSTSEAAHAATADEATHAADADNAASATLAGHATTADEATHASAADTATSAGVALALEPTAASAFATDAELATGLATKSDTGHSHNIQDLGGAATDAQVPDSITISSAGSVDAGALKSGTVPSARLSLADSDVPDDITISSAGSVDAGALKSGTVPSARLSLADGDVPDGITIDGGNVTVASGQTLRVVDGGGAGKVLTSDASGNASWQTAAGGSSALYFAKNFTVNSGKSVTAGDVVEILSTGYIQPGDGQAAGEVQYSGIGDNASSVKSAKLTSSLFVVLYSTSSNLYAVAGTIGGTTITWGTPFSIVGSSYSANIGICRLSDTTAVVGYGKPHATTGETHYRIVTVSGTTVSVTASFDSTTSMATPVMARVSDTQFISVSSYNYSGNYTMYVQSGTYSGATIAMGSRVDFSTGDAPDPGGWSIVPVSSAYVVLESVYTGDFFGRVVTLSGTTPTVNGRVQLATGEATNLYAAASTATTNKLYAAFTIGSVYYLLTTTRSGTSFTGTQSATCSYDLRSVTEMAANEVVCGGYSSSEAQAYVQQATASSSSVSLGDYYRLGTSNTPDASSIGVHYLSSSQFIHLMKAGTLCGTLWSYSSGSRSRALGVADGSASGGSPVSVIVGGVSDNHSGLTPGKYYYAQDDGSLTDTTQNTRVGMAVSATEILLDMER
ncbi:hypothetical protein JW916_05285 [Candidatus Sumerlaeota bacterium]|nr:hypothetical protein [Candidatus Sumerlaeota bacterium]